MVAQTAATALSARRDARGAARRLVSVHLVVNPESATKKSTAAWPLRAHALRAPPLKYQSWWNTIASAATQRAPCTCFNKPGRRRGLAGVIGAEASFGLRAAPSFDA